VTRKLSLLLAGLTAVTLAALPGCVGSNNSTGPGSTNPGSPPAVTKIKCGGSTFVGPMMEEGWGPVYKKEKAVTLDYTLGGSGKGISSMAAREYDFGCTDMPMTDKELAEAKDGTVLHLPLVLGSLVPVYNLDLPEKLKFDGKVLGDIYMGKVTKWNDDQLKALNPGVTLPDQKIVVVRRQEPSGSTFIWSSFLNKTSEAWKDVKPAKEVAWPGDVTVGAKGTDGVASMVKQTPGAIGYVEVLYAVNNKMKFGTVRNKKGKDVAGDRVEAITAAAAAFLKDLPEKEKEQYQKELTFPAIVDADGEEAYPVCGAVWAVLYQQQKADKAKALQDFFGWAVHDGQKECAKLHYAPLPEDLVKKVDAKVATITAK
jgi:phosphate transport system substrate-binding protein